MRSLSAHKFPTTVQYQGYPFVKMVRWLRRKFPATNPVSIKFEKCRNNYGYTVFEKNRFVIAIDERLTEDCACGTLLHEWAHTLMWWWSLGKKELKNHYQEWSSIYGQVYGILYREFYECD